MAQIIKHRRGSVSALKDVTANVGELVMATGSIGDFNGPIVFVGDAAVAGGYKPVSRLYQGSTAPTISVGSHGSTMDGVPFYSTTAKTLYILDKGGNSDIDLTGNIEGNTISGVTINNLTGTTATITNISGSTITGTTISGSNVRVSSNLNVTGDISGSDMYLTGDAIIDGNITLGGNITIGNQTTDIIQFGGEVSSSILPIVHNAFDLGSADKNWKDLHVSGTAYINVLEAQQVNFNDLGILTDLSVSGNTYLGNGGDFTIVSGSLYNDQLTEKRLVVAGVDGLLTDYSGITFDNGNLNLSGALEVTNIQGTGSLYLKPDLNDSRDFRIYNTAPSDIHIKGNAAYSFFGDDTNYLKIDDNTSGITINSISGVSINTGATTVTGSLYNDQLTDNRILVAGPDGLVGDSQYLTYDEVTLKVGAFEVDIADGDVRTTGSVTTNKIYGNTTNNNSLHLNGGDLGAPDVELESAGQISLFSEGLGSNYAINMTGSVYLANDINVTGSAQFLSTINVDGIATVSSSVVEDLTQYRVVGVGSAGALIDYSGFTYNGTTLQVGGGQFEVDNADGDIRTSGSLTVDGGITNNGDLTVNGVLTVTGNTQLQANLYVSGNLEVLGTATNVNIQSSTIELDDNIIRLNAYSPFERYAGFEVIDSGSTGVSASMLWDSQNDYWLFISSSGQSSKFVGTTFGPSGVEVSLTSGSFPIATSTNTIGDSLLTYTGTTLALNNNKFTVDSSNGDTLVSGNFTLSFSGGTDNGTKTSAIVFKNSSNILGFVTTTETTDVLDGILGYKNSDGTLKFSTVIDGGTY